MIIARIARRVIGQEARNCCGREVSLDTVSSDKNPERLQAYSRVMCVVWCSPLTLLHISPFVLDPHSGGSQWFKGGQRLDPSMIVEGQCCRRLKDR